VAAGRERGFRPLAGIVSRREVAGTPAALARGEFAPFEFVLGEVFFGVGFGVVDGRLILV